MVQTQTENLNSDKIFSPFVSQKARGGGNFLFSGRIPFAGRGVGTAARIGKILAAVPPSEADSNRFLSCSAVAKPPLIFLISPWNLEKGRYRS